ncbi:DUF4358 domain-containing protein [Pseudoflavonifractor sp. MSJ-37]|uniref:DUF4358 domain-containing protein n=1 Tax=Pseudoflavonifractor sp. MSJ-37 TaxID=2841531 RepID=UPI001C10DADA|nr:DUF4358 domain-containing protein [Pseudoflavonifractor sp. MSJ-37]MBU5435163.1 DUF4358 domain-containing protein [Pseudoflavonifractor sp. MSJ-37]
MLRSILRRSLPLLAVLCLTLTACGGSGSGAAPFDPASAAQALQDSGAFSEPLEQMDKDLACGTLYDISADDVADCAVYTTPTAGAEEIAVFAMTSEDAAKSALSALEQRVVDQKEALASYQPDEVSKLDAAVLEQRGSSVLLAVANDADAARKAVDALK